MASHTGGSIFAEHLCVLVHGLWGNPNHMANIAKSLRSRYSADELYILIAERNSGSFTYDGVELGGERVCLEIQEVLRAIKSRGGLITKLSVVGYSLGGLVARYALGLMYAKGDLDQIECMNFTAFASPFLGVRTPLHGWANQAWNVIGARALSESGRQLFTVDDFRGSGRPLLAILADPEFIFMCALRRFKRRTLYSNVVNDRSAVYYTTGISKTDPYTDTSLIKAHYVPGYADVVLDPHRPVSPRPAPALSAADRVRGWAGKAPFLLALAVILPVASAALLVTSLVQTARSSQRIRQHEKGLAGIDTAEFRVPLLIKELRGAVEDAYENLNSSQGQEYLGGRRKDGEEESEESEEGASSILALERRQSAPDQPTLALTPHQFSMIRSLDALGWRKYPVWIHNHRHSHAAIIVRSDKASFAEGWVVLKHWTQSEFLF